MISGFHQPLLRFLLFSIAFFLLVSGTWAGFSPLTSHRHHHHRPQQQKEQHRQRKPSIQLEMTPLRLAKALITKAIAIGAPLYNEGNIDECANVYQGVAFQVAQSNALPQFLQASLQQTLVMADQQSSLDAAWAFRGQFDSILDYQEPFTPAVSSNSRLQDSKRQPFTNQIMFLNDPAVVNDNVMGGRSSCQWEEATKTFKGTVSLLNNGGFASLRWRFKTTQNWSHAKGIYIQLHGSHSKPMEHTFIVLLKDTLCEQIRGANYKVSFANPTTLSSPTNTDADVVQARLISSDGVGSSFGGNAQATTSAIITSSSDNEGGAVIYIPFTAFNRMEQMGRKVMISSSASPPSFNPGAVTEIGIMAAKPTIVGDFELTMQDWGLFV
jgi:Complex I intermediate-associated protein 30 (CIA30)